MSGHPQPFADLHEYLQSLRAAFDCACQAQPCHDHAVQLADVRVTLRFAGAAMTAAMLPALAHLMTANGAAGAGGVTFHCWDTAATGVLPPHPPFAGEEYHRYGQRAVAYAGAISLMHAPGVPMLFAYDRTTRQGFFWTGDASQQSIYERAAPLQTLFQWAMAEFGWQVVHAAAVGTATGGVLLIGNTGAGKSTTALSCLTQPQIKFLCDDKCLARLAPVPQAYALFSAAKLKGDILERLPHFRTELAGWDDKAKGGKGLVFLHPKYRDHMIPSFPIKALLLPAVTHGEEAAFRPIPPGLVFRQLGPSTVIWLPGAEADNYRFTADLTRRLPTYQLDLARDPQRNSAAIQDLLAQLA